MDNMIITIDGPAGAGKSTIARALAGRLGFDFLDTGAMYRAVTLAGMRRELDWDRPDGLAELARDVEIELIDDRVFLDGEDVSEEIRSREVTSLSRHAAGNPAVRQRLVELQRAAAGGKDMVTEGRDQGTVVFPDARCKVFLTASPEERAVRRVRDLESRGESATLAEVLGEQERRDRRDSSRSVGPLVKASDAVELNTDGMTPPEVVDRLVSIVQTRQ